MLDNRIALDLAVPKRILYQLDQMETFNVCFVDACMLYIMQCMIEVLISKILIQLTTTSTWWHCNI